MTAENIDNVAELVITRIEQSPELRGRLYNIVDRAGFATRSELVEILKEIRLMREDQAKRFEAMDKRFEESNRRFEALQKEMNERFEESNRRFEALQKEMNERFEAVDRRFEAMDKRFEDMNKILVGLQVSMAELSGKYGKRAEDALRKILDEIISDEGIEPTKVQHIQVIDPKGKVFTKGYTTDIDIYYEGKKRWIIEYKARAEKSDIMHLSLVGKLMAEIYKMPADRLIMVALNISNDAVTYAEEIGIEIIHGIQANPILMPPP